MSSRRRLLADSISSSLSSTLFVDLDNRLLQGLLGKHPSGAYMGEIPTNSERGAFCGWETGFFYRACYELPEAWKNAETISDSWEEIIRSCDNGTYTTKYSLGDTKIADFGDEGLVLMRLIGFDCDELADESGYCHIAWIGEHCLKTPVRWNPNDSGVNYSRSNARKTIDAMIYKLPYILQSKILEVKKTCSTYSSSVYESVNAKIWIPSLQEYQNASGASAPVYPNFPVYTNPPKPIKKTGITPDGSPSGCWLRTPYIHPSYGDNAWALNTEGGYFDTGVNMSWSLIPCFCI